MCSMWYDNSWFEQQDCSFLFTEIYIYTLLKKTTCQLFSCLVHIAQTKNLHCLGSTFGNVATPPVSGFGHRGTLPWNLWQLRHQRVPFLWHPRAQRRRSSAARKSGHWMCWTGDGGMESWETSNGRDTCLEKIGKYHFFFLKASEQLFLGG